MIQRLLIAGGKTGGHLYPGVAVAEEIQRRNADAQVVFVGTADGLEARVIPRLGYPLETLSVSRLQGGGLFERLHSLVRVPVAMLASWRLLRRHRPQVVLGVGGYASGPALLAAWLLRYPTAIQEQNAYPGMTNRLLGRLVRHVYLGFDAAARFFERGHVFPTGNPIRRALVEALGAVERVHGEPGALRVLIFGGSQGSRFLNERVPAALLAFYQEHPEVRLTVTHQTGRREVELTQGRYQGTPLEAATEVTPFIDDMPTAYGQADVAVCRAGALTVAELTAVGLPALLVPFAHASDNHQEANALVLADAGAAVMVREAEWRPGAVVSFLEGLVDDVDRRRSMGEAGRRLARPEAALTLVDRLESLAP